MELLGTIKARFFQAFKSTVLGKDTTIDNVEAELDAKLTFLPGQIKRLKTYLKDNPLSLDYIEDLEQLEWLLLSEADVLPYDINAAGKFIVRAAPTATITQWPITRNARAFKGLELHLPTTNVVMGDAKGETYPEWIADTGPLLWYLNSLDQKSGKILAKAGGGIETQERMKFGEAHGVKIEYVQGSSYQKLERSSKSAALGAGGDFVLQSQTNDIDFCFANLELNRFKFMAHKDISFLSSKMRTTAAGMFQGNNLFLKPDDRYTGSYILNLRLGDSGAYGNRFWECLTKDVSFVYVDGDLSLDIAKSANAIGSFGIASGKLLQIRPLQSIVKSSINGTNKAQCYTKNGKGCCGNGNGTQHNSSYVLASAGLMTSDQMLLEGYQAIMQGIGSVHITVSN